MRKNDKIWNLHRVLPNQQFYLVSSIAHKLFQDEINIVPTFALGHSLGEFSALVSIEALELIDGVELVHLRGKLMAKACEDIDVGMMVSLGVDDEVVEEITKNLRDNGKNVWAVNYNANGQIVIAGVKKDLVTLEPLLPQLELGEFYILICL